MIESPLRVDSGAGSRTSQCWRAIRIGTLWRPNEHLGLRMASLRKLNDPAEDSDV